MEVSCFYDGSRVNDFDRRCKRPNRTQKRPTHTGTGSTSVASSFSRARKRRVAIWLAENLSVEVLQVAAIDRAGERVNSRRFLELAYLGDAPGFACGYGVFVEYAKKKGASRGSARAPEDLHRSGSRRPPSRPGHSTQGHGGELRRHSFDPRVGPSSRPDDTPAHPHPRGRVQRGVEGPAVVRRRRRDRGGPGRLLRAQAAGGAPCLVQHGH